MSKRLFQEIIGAAEIAVGVVIGNLDLIIQGTLTFGAAILAPTPPKPPATEAAIKSPIPPRVSAYGRGRLYLTFGLFTTASSGTACDAGALHDGLIDGYERFYLGDKQVATGVGVVAGLPDGTYKTPSVEIDARLGLATETAYSQLIALLPDSWTTNHRGDDVATAMVTWKEARTKDYQELYPNGQPALSAAARWQLVFDWRDLGQSVTDPSTWVWSENAILHLAHYLLVRQGKNWDLHFAPTLSYWTAAAVVCDTAIALNGVQAVLTAPFNSGHITMQLNSVNGLSVGMSVVISATGDTSLSETRTVVSISGLSVVVATITNDHPQGSAVTWTSDPDAPATEPRYRSCVAHSHTDAHKDVVANLLACCDGWMSPRSDGALMVYAGQYVAPTVTIGPDQIIAYSLQDGIAEEDSVNQLTVTYVSDNHDFNTVDTDAWEDADDISARGKILSNALSNQVPSGSQARRLAKRAMAETMAPKRGTATTNAAGRGALGQRYVQLVLSDAGDTFLDAPVQIKKMVRNLTTGGVTFDWILADPNIDAWDALTEEGLPAPVGNPVAPEPLTAPAVVSAIFFGGDNVVSGVHGARIRIVASGPDRADLTWFVRWRVVGDVAWVEQEYNDTDPGPSVTLETGFVAVDANVEVEVAYRVGDGRLSPYSDPPRTVDTGSVTFDSTDVSFDTTEISWDRT